MRISDCPCPPAFNPPLPQDGGQATRSVLGWPRKPNAFVWLLAAAIMLAEFRRDPGYRGLSSCPGAF